MNSLLSYIIGLYQLIAYQIGSGVQSENSCHLQATMSEEEQNDPQRNQRRKRKDPESRDFICRCGKSYLSYAAAYTHVKNKHQSQSDYFSNISKPGREKLKRGRPKEKKMFTMTAETERLSIIEEAILQIYEVLEEQKEAKAILEGNHQVPIAQLFKSYQDLVAKMGQPSLQLYFQTHPDNPTIALICNFLQAINKHFVASLAAKIIWFVNEILAPSVKSEPTDEPSNHSLQVEVDVEAMKGRLGQSWVQALWAGGKIPECVVDVLGKWMKIGGKDFEPYVSDE